MKPPTRFTTFLLFIPALLITRTRVSFLLFFTFSFSWQWNRREAMEYAKYRMEHNHAAKIMLSQSIHIRIYPLHLKLLMVWGHWSRGMPRDGCMPLAFNALISPVVQRMWGLMISCLLTCRFLMSSLILIDGVFTDMSVKGNHRPGGNRWLGRGVFGHNRLMSWCLQVQQVTCWHPSVFLY